METKNKLCPFCGGNVLKFVHEKHYGHGDSGFNGRIYCCSCGASKGNVSDYGDPDPEDEVEAWRQWNERKI